MTEYLDEETTFQMLQAVEDINAECALNSVSSRWTVRRP